LFDFDGPVRPWARVVHPIGLFVCRRIVQTGGCFLFCTRAAFEAAGGFDERYFAAEELHFFRALKRIGRVVIPRAKVITSGRKLDGMSLLDALRLFRHATRDGGAALRSREALPVWYGPRESQGRDEPSVIDPS
jgi:hypothetical protein